MLYIKVLDSSYLKKEISKYINLLMLLNLEPEILDERIKKLDLITTISIENAFKEFTPLEENNRYDIIKTQLLIATYLVTYLKEIHSLYLALKNIPMSIVEKLQEIDKTISNIEYTEDDTVYEHLRVLESWLNESIEFNK